jgi:hypothetical protein
MGTRRNGLPLMSLNAEHSRQRIAAPD